MRPLLVFTLLIAAAAACSDMQRLKVKSQWHKVYGMGKDRDQAGRVIWRGLFALKPESRDLFKRVNGDDVKSPEFTAHSARVLGGLDIAISLLDTPDILKVALEHLHVQHVERHIPPSYFDVMKQVFMQFVPSKLGRCYDQEAWDSCFDVIAQGIVG
nr:haemoglobin A4 chain [Arenicola marina]